MDVSIREPDVSPLQLQGPKSGAIMTALFGDWIEELAYYWLREAELDGIPLVVSRTGWSSELGYEIYLRDGSRGDELWEKIMAVGAPLGLKPGHTSSIRRIEGAMLSYHADATIDTNPFELGLDRLVAVDSDVDFIGKDALRRIRDEGVTRKQVGIVIEMEPLTGRTRRSGRSQPAANASARSRRPSGHPPRAEHCPRHGADRRSRGGHCVDDRDEPGPRRRRSWRSRSTTRRSRSRQLSSRQALPRITELATRPAKI